MLLTARELVLYCSLVGSLQGLQLLKFESHDIIGETMIRNTHLLRSQSPILWRTLSLGIKHVLLVDTKRELSVFHLLRIYICVQSYIRCNMFLQWL